MLSLFPQLLDWNWYVPFAFRLFLGFYSCYIGWTFVRRNYHTENRDERSAQIFLGALLFLFGFFFVSGLYVQALGSIGFVLALFALLLKQKKSLYTEESAMFYFLISLVSLSLVFLGPGPYSVDLPL